MQRWWNSGDAARDALGRVDDSDLVMGVGTALLGYHGLAKEALAPLIESTLVDPELVLAYLEDIDITPVAEAISKAVASDLPEPVAEHYGRLLAQDVHRRALQATPRLASALVAKGASWPTAVRRSANVVGVPLERLGAYPTAVTKAGLNELGADDAADRVLMAWASAISGAVPRESVSKAERERVRGHEKEQEPFDEATVNRDELGRFAEEESHQQKMARQARMARKKRRRARQAASRAAVEQQKAKSASAQDRNKATNRAGVASNRSAEAVSRAVRPGARAVSRAQARAAIANAAKTLPNQQMELERARDEADAGKAPKPKEAAFHLPRRYNHWSHWDDGSLGVMAINTFTMEGVEPDTAQEVYLDEDVLETLGGPDAFHGRETFSWSMRGVRAALNMPHATHDFEEVWEARKTMPEITLDTFDPALHERHVTLSEDDLMTMRQYVNHQPGALAMRKHSGADPAIPKVQLQTGTLSELPAGSTWTVDEEYDLKIVPAVANWKGYDGRMQEVHFQVPAYNQFHTADGVRKAERERTERERTGAPERKFEESEVNRDALGRFAAESSSAERDRAAARMARKKRRTKRRARQAAFAAREREAAATARAEREPAKATNRAARAVSRTGRAAARTRIGQAVARARSAPRQTTSDEMPIGLTMHSRKDAPDTGPYTLDEPLYTLHVADTQIPTAVMTEEQMTRFLRGNLTGGVGRRLTQNRYGQKVEGWGPHKEHQHVPEIFRYEPGTLPIGGRNARNEFFTATQDQINQTWESSPFTGEGPSTWEFMVAAPGDKYDRRPQPIQVPITQIITHFSKADSIDMHTYEVHKRERERGNEPDRKFDESEVNRDELGRFAVEATDEQTAARTRRLQRKARRAKRHARAQAWQARQREAAAPERDRQQAVSRTGQARSRAAEARRERVAASRALRPERGREMSQAARRVLPQPEPDLPDWENALKAPHETELGKFIGQAGYLTTKTKLDWKAMNAQARHSATSLYEGQSVTLASMWDELSRNQKGLPAEAAFQAAGTSLRAILRPVMGDLKQDNEKNIYEMAVSLLSEAMNGWTPTPETNRKVLGEWGDSIRTSTTNYDSLSLTDDGLIVRDDAPGSASQIHPVVVGGRTKVLLRQADAMLSYANAGAPLDSVQMDLARNGWKKVRDTSAFGLKPIQKATAHEVRDAAYDLLNEMEVSIHAMPDKAMVETARLAMSKQKASDIRLDDRGVFLITSKLDTKNGWTTLADRQKKES